MYHLTLMWLALVGAAFVAGILHGRMSARRKLARMEALAFALECPPRDGAPIPREHMAAQIRSRLRGGS